MAARQKAFGQTAGEERDGVRRVIKSVALIRAASRRRRRLGRRGLIRPPFSRPRVNADEPPRHVAVGRAARQACAKDVSGRFACARPWVGRARQTA